MKSYFLVNRGLEQCCQTELLELSNIPPINITIHQSVRRVLAAITQTKEIESITLKNIDFNWSNFFTSELSFKVEVEGISGNVNRMHTAKELTTSITHFLEAHQHF